MRITEPLKSKTHRVTENHTLLRRRKNQGSGNTAAVATVIMELGLLKKCPNIRRRKFDNKGMTINRSTYLSSSAEDSDCGQSGRSEQIILVGVKRALFSKLSEALTLCLEFLRLENCL